MFFSSGGITEKGRVVVVVVLSQITKTVHSQFCVANLLANTQRRRDGLLFLFRCQALRLCIEIFCCLPGAPFCTVSREWKIIITIIIIAIYLKGAIGEISNYYTFSPRLFIYGTHIPPVITIHAASSITVSQIPFELWFFIFRDVFSKSIYFHKFKYTV